MAHMCAGCVTTLFVEVIDVCTMTQKYRNWSLFHNFRVSEEG